MQSQPPSPCLTRPSEPGRPGRVPAFFGPLRRLLRRQIATDRDRPKTRVVTLNDPEAFADRPGERRIVFSNRVIIVSKR